MGVYVKRINIVGFENAVGTVEKKPVGGDTYRFTVYEYQNPAFLPGVNPHGMCNALMYNTSPIDRNNIDNVIAAFYNGGIFARCDARKTVDEFIEWAKSVDLKVQYILVTPIEIPLSETELAAYRALHTNKPNTTILNDSGAHMKVDYTADTKLYIDNKIAALMGS